MEDKKIDWLAFDDDNEVLISKFVDDYPCTEIERANLRAQTNRHYRLSLVEMFSPETINEKLNALTHEQK